MHTTVDTEAIWGEFHGHLFAFIRGRVATDQDAEDILQDVFTRIHTNADRLGDVHSVSGYLYRTTRNVIVDHYRSGAKNAAGIEKIREGVTPQDACCARDDEESGMDAQRSAALSGCMKALLDQLPETYRNALELTELEGMTQKDAADQMGLSISGMKSRVQRGRGKLKKVLLDCCHFELDQRLRIVDFAPRDPNSCCDSCD